VAWIDERGLSTGRDRPQISAAEFLERSGRLLGIPAGRLAVQQRDAAATRLRYLMAGVGIERWRQRPTALARCLGGWPEAVGRWALRAGELRVTDEAFGAAFESLDEWLAGELGEPVTTGRRCCVRSSPCTTITVSLGLASVFGAALATSIMRSRRRPSHNSVIA
jgi:hypothetical protein